jgi:hypothetical protein
VLVKALEQQCDNEEICEWAMAAIDFLSDGSEGNMELFKDKNIFQVACSTMERHSDHAGLSQSFCGVVRNFCAVDAMKEELGKAGAPKCVVNLLKEHSSDEETISIVFEVVGLLCFICNLNLELLYEAGASAEINQLLSSYESTWDNKVCDKGRDALNKLGYGL